MAPEPEQQTGLEWLTDLKPVGLVDLWPVSG